MPQSAIAVANFFVIEGQRAGRLVDPMKLQKLVYFAHGWHLAVRGEPLLDERVEAWPYGPVIPSIYHEVKRHGAAPIDFPIFQYARRGRQAPEVTDPEVRELLQRVWEVYGRYSAVELSRMAHDPDGPWHRTWEGEAQRGAIKGVDIPDDEIRDYFVRSGLKARTTTTTAAYG